MQKCFLIRICKNILLIRTDTRNLSDSTKNDDDDDDDADVEICKLVK